MEILLEQEEVEVLLREALAARRIEVPLGYTFRVRTNHKKGTFRVLFHGPEKRDER